MRFIDLFAGLGGFHKALHELGHECVFASEINTTLKEVYKINWGIEPKGDIRKIVDEQINEIPAHDILCAGFPCQPFSKAGNQLGRADIKRGTLFDEIVNILRHRSPKFFILENVPFIAKHDNEATWKYMEKELKIAGYKVDHEIYSPQDFGIPQHRKRIFIVGSLVGLDHFSFKNVDNHKKKIIDIYQYIENNPKDAKELSKEKIECLKLWQEFLNCIPKETKLPGFPIWGMEFGANYPYEEEFPHVLSDKELSLYKGSFGRPLKGMSRAIMYKYLPSYAKMEEKFPQWKRSYIRQSRQFYLENKKYVKKVVKQIARYESQSWQKLEWNVGDKSRKINNYILQFRASGIRVKEVNFFPSLVCTSTQIPIIGWQNRYITKEEAKKLQSLEGLKLPKNDNAAFKALGNAVNSKIVKLIAKELLNSKEVISFNNIDKKLLSMDKTLNVA